MNEGLKQQIQQRLKSEPSYEVRALLISAAQFIEQQEHEITMKSGMVDAQAWDHQKW